MLALTAVGLTGVVTGAYFTDTDTVTGNTFTTGSVALSATPAASAITLAGMAPGDKVTGAITVTNAGTLSLRYAVSSVTTEDLFADQLELTVKTGVTTCTNAGFGTDGSPVYSAGDLGSTAGTKIIGDSAQGPQPGDRDLAAGVNEVLCAQVVLPMTATNTFQGKTTTATLAFNAEQAVAAAGSLLSGTLTGTEVAASWTAVPGATSYTLTQVATTGTAGFANPDGIAVAADGTMYVADTYNQLIRKVTAAGVVTTLAGSGQVGSAEGTGAAAEFNHPFGVAVAADGTVYVADAFNHRIRKVTAAGVVTTLAGSTAGVADGTGAAAQFDAPYGVALAADGTMYVADANNNLIRKVTAAGVVTTLAGQATPGSADGTGAAAQFSTPVAVAVGADGTVYVADVYNSAIRKVTAAGVVTTLAGGTQGFADGTGAAAQFDSPMGVAVGADGTVYVADEINSRIRKVTAAGVVTTLAGSGDYAFADGAGAAAKFSFPYGIAVAADGIVYVGDNRRIRKVTAAGDVTTLAGGAQGSADSTPPTDVSTVVYTGTALSYTDFDLLLGTPYTYTVTAVGPGTVSNTIGPFMP